jgi:hypothetical protein
LSNVGRFLESRRSAAAALRGKDFIRCGSADAPRQALGSPAGTLFLAHTKVARCRFATFRSGGFGIVLSRFRTLISTVVRRMNSVLV